MFKGIPVFSILCLFILPNISVAQNISQPMSIDKANSPLSIPKCEREDSDSDGDGWGWENMASCKVGEELNYVVHPTCELSDSDPDGDGWGWENNSSCKVISSSVADENPSIENEEDSPLPTCKLSSSDPDGDGWGWENESSCKVQDSSLTGDVDSSESSETIEELEEEIQEEEIPETQFVTTVDSSSTVTTVPSPSSNPQTLAGAKSFSEIENQGMQGSCYKDDDHYVAEYLYQNPDVCYWEVENINGEKQVVPLDLPSIPNNAIALPAPSGGDDTSAIEKLINASPNKTFYGNGRTYKLDSLEIRQNGTVIHDMPSIPANLSVGRMIHIKDANDVKLYNSPQDGQNNPNFYVGIQAEGDRFHIVHSGLTNMFHKGGNSGGGVYIRRRQEDFHIACNTYKNILSQKSGTGTARANAVWYNGGTVSASGDGYIVNNIAENLQSTGAPTNGGKDAEFLTMQSFSGHDGFVRVFANRGVDAGKRLTKFQATGGAKVLSNYYEWKTNETPELGPRTRLAIVSLPGFNASNVFVRNNRFKINGNKNWSYVFMNNTKSGGASKQENVHFDCNDIEINNPWNGEGYDQVVFVGRDKNGTGGTDSSNEPSNSTIENNRVYGTGSVNYNYWMGPGFDLNSGRLQPTNNTFNLNSKSPRQGIERKN